MAWIKVIDESEATDEVKAHYDELKSKWGYVPNLRKVHSLKPKLMCQYHAFSHTVTFGGTSLGRRREEMMAVMISSLLKCKY